MSNLPSPKEFKSFVPKIKAKDIPIIEYEYDLVAMDKNFKKAQMSKSIKDKALELLNRKLWYQRKEVFRKYIGYSTKYNSLTVSLYDESNQVQAICIREAKDRGGNPIKWKTYGSKRFIPYRIFDKDNPLLFIGFGIGEFLLFELLQMNYIAFQSDSIAKSLTIDKAPKIANYFLLMVLLDNDKSCKETITPLKDVYSKNLFVEVDFELLLDRDLPKGYDFRDFCNEIALETHSYDLKNTILEYLGNEVRLSLPDGI